MESRSTFCLVLKFFQRQLFVCVKIDCIESHMTELHPIQLLCHLFIDLTMYIHIEIS